MIAREYVEKIMRQMEEDELTQGEVERVLVILPKAIKANE